MAEIVDLTEMEIKAQNRRDGAAGGRAPAGAAANVQVEALPGSPMNGASKGVGSPAQKAFWEPETSRQFNAAFALTSPSAALRPGMTARVAVAGTDAEERDSPAAPGAVRKGWEARRLHPRWARTLRLARCRSHSITETRVVLRDFPSDVDVALINPETATVGSPGSTSATALPGAAR